MATKRTTEKAPAKSGAGTKRKKAITAEGARLGWKNGGWVDERISESAVSDAIRQNQLSIDAGEFMPWLAENVGSYRMWQAGSDSAPTAADELAHARRLVDDIASLETRISNLPPATDAHATYATLKARGEPLWELQERLSRDLHSLRAALSYAADRIEPYSKSKGGRKRAVLRHDLLSAVAEKIRIMSNAGASESLQCAADVLNACDLKAPEDGRIRSVKGMVAKTGKK